jgi:hypothetical protein
MLVLQLRRSDLVELLFERHLEGVGGLFAPTGIFSKMFPAKKVSAIIDSRLTTCTSAAVATRIGPMSGKRAWKGLFRFG